MRLLRGDDGWTLAGVAVGGEHGAAYRLDYVVSTDTSWRTRACVVHGAVGARPVAISIERDDSGRWTLDGAAVTVVAGCADVDLSFTPATNLLPIRRLALAVGAGAKVRAAWLRVPALDLQPLEQQYTRTATATYDYESGGTFQRMLTVDSNGIVCDYPTLWVAESAAR